MRGRSRLRPAALPRLQRRSLSSFPCSSGLYLARRLDRIDRTLLRTNQAAFTNAIVDARRIIRAESDRAVRTIHKTDPAMSAAVEINHGPLYPPVARFTQRCVGCGND